MSNTLGKMSKLLACLAWIPVLAAIPLAAQSVSIYLEPTKEGTIYFKEDLAELNKRNPQPYPPDLPKTEWMTVQYPGTYVGYVQPESINDDMTVKPGTAILVRPLVGGRTLAVVDDSIEPQVIEMGPNWCTVYYEGDATTFFPWPSERPPEPVVAEIVTATSAPAEGGEIVAVAEAEEAIVPVMTAPAAPAPASSGAAAPAFTSAASAPVPAPPPPATSSAPPELAPMAAASRPTVPVSPPPPPLTSKQVTRVWEGKLVRNKGLDKLFSKDYPYYLENAAGDRIAYVDLSETLLFQPVENYWGAQVIIDGTAEKLVDTTPILIKARVIRPKF